jgi:cathepsin L
VEQIESDAIRTLNVSAELSVEQIIDCNPYVTTGCSGVGGDICYGFNYLLYDAKGLMAAADYPYTSYEGTAGTCDADDYKAVVDIDYHYYFNSGYESLIASYVQSTGPVSVSVDVTNWNTYTGGVMTVCSQYVNNFAQAVGVDASSNGYWKVRNSWGASWGEAGFIRLAYGNDTCGVADYVDYLTVRKA